MTAFTVSKLIAPAALAAACLGSIAACTPVPRDLPTSFVSAHRNVWREKPLSEAFVRFAGPVQPQPIAMRERHFGSALAVQEITLTNDTVLPGENFIRVIAEYRTSVWYDVLYPDEIDIKRRALATHDVNALIDSGFADVFPGLDVSVSQNLPVGRYGPYNYAEASNSSGVTCLFAWQTLDPGGAEEIQVPDTVDTLTLQMRVCAPEGEPRDYHDMFRSIVFEHWTGILPDAYNPFPEPVRGVDALYGSPVLDAPEGIPFARPEAPAPAGAPAPASAPAGLPPIIEPAAPVSVPVQPLVVSPLPPPPGGIPPDPSPAGPVPETPDRARAAPLPLGPAAAPQLGPQPDGLRSDRPY
jgi:hypothetical protein